jgi:hypothetical protein
MANACTRSDGSVEARGHLQGDKCAAGGAMMRVRLVEFSCFFARRTDVDLHPGCSKLCDAASANSSVGILNRYYDAPQARRDDGLRARRRAALVIARLERDVERAPARLFPGMFERSHLGVGRACLLMMSFANRGSVSANDDCADQGVRTRVSSGFRREVESPAHVVSVIHGGF